MNSTQRGGEPRRKYLNPGKYPVNGGEPRRKYPNPGKYPVNGDFYYPLDDGTCYTDDGWQKIRSTFGHIIERNVNVAAFRECRSSSSSYSSSSMGVMVVDKTNAGNLVHQTRHAGYLGDIGLSFSVPSGPGVNTTIGTDSWTTSRGERCVQISPVPQQSQQNFFIVSQPQPQLMCVNGQMMLVGNPNTSIWKLFG